MSVPITKPTVGGSDNTWGTQNNTCLDALNGADYFAARTGDGGAINSTTLQDDSALQLTLPAGTFMVTARLLATSPAGSDVKFAWAFTGTLTTNSRSGIGPTIQTTSVISATAATTVGVNRASVSGDTGGSFANPTSYGTDGTNITAVHELGYGIVTVGGILKVQLAQVVAAASLVLKAGSFLYARQVA